MGLKRFLRKAVKLGSKIARPLLATTPVGAIALRAQQTLKSLGGNLKAERLGKIEPLSVRGAIEKVAPRPALTLKRFGGSPGRKSLAKKASRIAQDRKTRRGKGRRSPPPGGLDLKRMAAAWRAAGKPGSWRDWIRSNQLRKGA